MRKIHCFAGQLAAQGLKKLVSDSHRTQDLKNLPQSKGTWGNKMCLLATYHLPPSQESWPPFLTFNPFMCVCVCVCVCVCIHTHPSTSLSIHLPMDI